MSVLLMAQVWQLDLGHPEQSVLLALADHADDDGRDVYPSLAYVAWKTGYSERQVRRVVGALRDSGVLELVQEASQHRANEYRIVIAAASKKPAFDPKARADNMSALGSARGDTVSGLAEAPGRTSTAPRADTAMSAEPSGTTKATSPTGTLPRRAVKETTPTEQGEVDRAAIDRLPADLREFVGPVQERLAEVASGKAGAIDPSAAAVARLLGRFRRKDFIPLADDFAHWSLHGRGRGKPIKDVVVSYRNWIAKEPDVLRKTPVRHLAAVAPQGGVGDDTLRRLQEADR